jgi:Spy/CpxP family protein refolding chaperone
MMYTLRSTRLMIAALLAALAGLLAVVPAHAAPHGHGGGFMSGRMLERMLDGVSATDAQRTEIRQIAEAASADLRSEREAGAALRRQSLELFAQPTVDAAAAEALRQKMVEQHDVSSKRTLQAMLDISRVLTPEQRATLAERMKKRGDSMRHRHGDRKR